MCSSLDEGKMIATSISSLIGYTRLGLGVESRRLWTAQLLWLRYHEHHWYVEESILIAPVADGGD